MLRLLNYAAVWLVKPERREEARLKIAAYWRIALLGAALRPEALPRDLQRENADCSGHVFRAEPVLA